MLKKFSMSKFYVVLDWTAITRLSFNTGTNTFKLLSTSVLLCGLWCITFVEFLKEEGVIIASQGEVKVGRVSAWALQAEQEPPPTPGSL